MGRVVVELRSEPWPNAEADLVKALVEAAPEHEVFPGEALRVEREAEAESLRERLPTMSHAERQQAVTQFAARHGPFGGDASRLHVEVERLQAESAAHALLGSLPQLSAAGRIAAVEEYGRQYGRFSDHFERLHRNLVVVDPATAEAVPSEVVAAPIGEFEQVVTIAIPAITGTLANRVVDAAIDWVRRRASRSYQPRAVRIYGPDGEVIREVQITWTRPTLDR